MLPNEQYFSPAAFFLIFDFVPQDLGDFLHHSGPFQIPNHLRRNFVRYVFPSQQSVGKITLHTWIVIRHANKSDKNMMAGNGHTPPEDVTCRADHQSFHDYLSPFHSTTKPHWIHSDHDIIAGAAHSVPRGNHMECESKQRKHHDALDGSVP